MQTVRRSGLMCALMATLVLPSLALRPATLEAREGETTHLELRRASRQADLAIRDVLREVRRDLRREVRRDVIRDVLRDVRRDVRRGLRHDVRRDVIRDVIRDVRDARRRAALDVRRDVRDLVREVRRDVVRDVHRLRRDVVVRRGDRAEIRDAMRRLGERLRELERLEAGQWH